jgi:hypothetical protein
MNAWERGPHETLRTIPLNEFYRDFSPIDRKLSRKVFEDRRDPISNILRDLRHVGRSDKV